MDERRPDGVQRGLVAEIIARFARKGFTLRAMKMMNVSKEHAEKHYADLSAKPFFGGLVSYMCSGPVVAMVWEGKEFLLLRVHRILLKCHWKVKATNPMFRKHVKKLAVTCFFRGC